MNEININAEDYQTIRKFEDILRRGYYCDGGQVTELHNRVLGTRLASTNCGSCIRQRINALVEAANKFDRLSQRLSESVSEVKVEDVENAVNLHSNSLGCLPQEENKELTEAEKMKERMAKVRAAKKDKK